MFQLLLKVSLFFSLFGCVSAESPPPLAPLELEAYEKFHTALATEFAPSRNMAKYLRQSIYNLLTLDVTPNGCRSFEYFYRFDEDLANYSSKLSNQPDKLNIGSSGEITLAGMVALEKAFPCIKSKFRLVTMAERKTQISGPRLTGSPSDFHCNYSPPTKLIGNLVPVWPFLGRNGISYTEMATLYKGVKMVDQSGETEKSNPIMIKRKTPSSNDTSFIKDFIDVYAKVLLIGKKDLNLVLLPKESFTC